MCTAATRRAARCCHRAGDGTALPGPACPAPNHPSATIRRLPTTAIAIAWCCSGARSPRALRIAPTPGSSTGRRGLSGDSDARGAATSLQPVTRVRRRWAAGATVAAAIALGCANNDPAAPPVEQLGQDAATYWPAATWRTVTPGEVAVDAPAIASLVARLRSGALGPEHTLVV